MISNEILEKVRELSPSELAELRSQIDGMLEDIEDNAAADTAEARGDFVPWEEAKQRILAESQKP